ncbi:MAG: DUF4905 domain-containing protein [Mucilaginibacter sp.]
MTALLPFISQQFNGAIWRLEIDSLSNIIFAEIRNSEDKTVSFSAIDLSTGKLNFKDLIQPERWLSGIEAAFNGVLLLHGYESASSPVHKGVTAIDAVSGHTLWTNYSYAFDHLSVNGPVLYNSQVQPKRLMIGDERNGALLRKYDPLIDSEPNNFITSPQILPVTFLQSMGLKIKPYGNSFHYLEYNNFRIISLHTFEAGKLRQHLYIVQNENVVYEDILSSDIQKIQPEAFILHKNCLIYIKNKHELKALDL